MEYTWQVKELWRDGSSGSHSSNFSTAIEAHCELGRRAQEQGLNTHIHLGSWVGNNAFSVAYKGDDPVLGARIIVRWIGDD